MYKVSPHHFITVSDLTKILNSIPSNLEADKYTMTLYPDSLKVLHLEKSEASLHYKVDVVFRYSRRNKKWFIEDENYFTVRIILD